VRRSGDAAALYVDPLLAPDDVWVLVDRSRSVHDRGGHATVCLPPRLGAGILAGETNMRIKMLTIVVLAGSIAAASCGGTSNASWPSCSWPASLDPDPADPSGPARDHCVAGRTRLSCALPDGSTQTCWTHDPTQCEGGNPPGAECHADCAENEFSARCGGVGPGPVPDPPASCRGDGFVPAGVAFYCCPCGA
jgi:hypothetical protein